jgi:hypothetical protein
LPPRYPSKGLGFDRSKMSMDSCFGFRGLSLGYLTLDLNLGVGFKVQGLKVYGLLFSGV